MTELTLTPIGKEQSQLHYLDKDSLSAIIPQDGYSIISIKNVSTPLFVKESVENIYYQFSNEAMLERVKEKFAEKYKKEKANN